MRPSDTLKLLVGMIEARLPALLTGAPGIGKTQLTEQATEVCKAELIYTDAGTSDNTRAEGMPWIDVQNKEAEFFPFGDLARALRAKKLTVWFIDDIGWASISVQNSWAHLIHERRTPSGRILPNCVSIIAATNRRTDRSGVSGLSEAIKSRFASIIPIEPNLDDLCQWAIHKGEWISARIVALFHTDAGSR